MPVFSLWIRKEAPVVQWIEHWSPEPKIWVRLPAGVPAFTRVVAFRVNRIKKIFR